MESNIYFSPYTHVERTRIELVEFLLATADAACGEEGRHTVGDGLLDHGEVVGSLVGTTEGIAWRRLDLGIDGCEVTGRKDHIRVEDYDIVAQGLIDAEVASRTRTGVVLAVIPYIESVGILVTHRLARY